MRCHHLFLLLRADLLRRPGRQLTAVVAIALAASVLLTSLATFHAARDQSPRVGDGLLGPTEVHVRADDEARPYLDDAVIERLAADPRVASLVTADRVRVIDVPGTEAGGLDLDRFHGFGPGESAGWGPQGRTALWAWRTDAEPPGHLVEGRWPSPDAIDPIELVVPALEFGGSKRARHPLGDLRSLEGDSGIHRAIVVGVLDVGLWSEHSRELPSYVISPAAAEALAGPAPDPADVRVVLHRADDRAAFVAEWRERLQNTPGHPVLWDRETLVDDHRDGFTVRASASVARTALLLAAACVACIALAVLGSAVRERSRNHRILRTIGAGRGTLVALVLLESAVLATAGLFGALLLAWAALAGLAPLLPFVSLSGGPPDLRSIGETFVVVLLGVLAGSAWPALLASRQRPAERGAPVGAAARRRVAAICAMAAAVVAAAAFATTALCGENSTARAATIAWVAVPATALVAILMAPLALRAAAAVFVRPLAWLLRTDRLALEDQVRGDEARSLASVLSISVGLGAFLLTLCWGASMLFAFVLDDSLPRWLVSVHPHGLARDETEAVLRQPGMAGMQPLVLVDTRVADRHANAGDAPADLSCLVAGIDVACALQGEHALPLRFVAGERATAAAALASEPTCLVSDWFAHDHGLAVGEPVHVAVPGGGEAVYRIRGIVDLHGWRMVFKHNKTRQRNFKQQLLVLVDADRVRDDFTTAHANYLIGDALDAPPYPPDLPLRDAFGVSRQGRDEVAAVVESAFERDRNLAGHVDAARPVTVSSRAVLVDDLDRTRRVLQTSWGGDAVRRLGWLPLLALILSLLPVTATQLAAMRARARELGVLRSCGLSRFGLLRLALAESLIVGVAATFTAALFGGVGAWLLLRVTTIVGYHLRFAGMKPDFVVPWQWLGPGWLSTLAVCTAAALFAAWRIGRTPPADLLQADAAARS